tara:strand:- start:46261 stop:46737 length:477 start_codon:yes stop_codon:yes gene_type:complete
MKELLIICAIAFGFIACEKGPGEGGNSVIEGQVYKMSTEEVEITEVDSLGYDTTYVIIDTIKAPQLYVGKDVFIIYSDNEGRIYDDKFETDYNGRYRFEFLRKGEYTIYTYADSTQSYSTTIPQDHLLDYEYPIFRHITISSNNSTNTVENFVIEKNQ